MQKFQRGDLVKVDEDLGEGRSHFESGYTGIVRGSYEDQYGGESIDCTEDEVYTICPVDVNGKITNELSWYERDDLALVKEACDETYIALGKYL